ncbi:MAG TPA: hypothetical protein EYQ14_18015 [Gammaproteobacteria bacterium]|nr:hypothetical protein [Gammaproteobacteria bacterium]
MTMLPQLVYQNFTWTTEQTRHLLKFEGVTYRIPGARITGTRNNALLTFPPAFLECGIRMEDAGAQKMD